MDLFSRRKRAVCRCGPYSRYPAGSIFPGAPAAMVQPVPKMLYAGRKREDFMKSNLLLAAAFAVLAATPMAAQAAELKYKPQPITNKEWETPFPGFKIVGNMYYVGTCDLGCYLIDTGAGLILINSGADGSYPLIKANIEKLGFKTSDIDRKSVV